MRMKLIEELTLMVRYAEELSESNEHCTNLNRRGSQLRKDKNTLNERCVIYGDCQGLCMLRHYANRDGRSNKGW